MQRTTLAGTAKALADGRASSRALVEDCLARIDDPQGEGARAFLHVDHAGARAAAEAIDGLRAINAAPSIYAGIPVSIKDLFDVAGQRTTAGSRILSESKPASSDAAAVARLRRAGFILIGRSNMTEFAFSGLGLNPHYGTPAAPWRRPEGHIAGGSTSGGAVSVADGMAFAALGTDTGGSCRIPAAFCGLVGFKPTARRVPLDGTVPLSPSLDSIGPLAHSVACCAAIDSVLSGEPMPRLAGGDIRWLTVGVLRNLVLEGMEAPVSEALSRAMSSLSAAGARLVDVDIQELNDIKHINAKGGFAAAEAFHWHRPLIMRGADIYDPRVLARIRRGEQQSASDYLDLLAARRRLILAVTERMSDFDAILFPTAPILPPPISIFESDEAFGRINLLVLRNSTVVNMIDGCAISIPIHRPGEPPVGLTFAGPGGSDHRLLRVAAMAEAAFARQ